MTSKEYVLDTMKKYGKATAEALQLKAPEMTGTELYDEYGYIPSYYAALAKCNMLERKAGFICRSPQGRVVKLLQPYDSNVYTGEPEELPAQYGFVWSKNPNHALPFEAISTSPYNVDECAVGNDGKVYASTIDGNVWEPTSAPQFWRVAEGV